MLQVFGPCHGPQDLWPTIHDRGTSSVSDNSVWHYWQTKRHWNKFNMWYCVEPSEYN